jgi:hypothetical protein
MSISSFLRFSQSSINSYKNFLFVATMYLRVGIEFRIQIFHINKIKYYFTNLFILNLNKNNERRFKEYSVFYIFIYTNQFLNKINLTLI